MSGYRAGLQKILSFVPLTNPHEKGVHSLWQYNRHYTLQSNIHLPLQSGSTALLKKMNRVYTKEDYLRLIDKIRKAIPDIAITTDIIVGFPGETEEDFEETLDVVRYAKFASAFTFIYSIRTGTPAAKMPDQVDEETVKKRFDRLLEVVGKYSNEYAASLTGKTMPVLVEEIDKENDKSNRGSGAVSDGNDDKNMIWLTGRLDNNLLVHFKGDKSLIGQIKDVELSECKGFYFIGRLKE